MENQTSFFGTIWQALVALFQSFGESNTVVIVFLVITIVIGALLLSEYSDRQKRKRINTGNRLKQRHK